MHRASMAEMVVPYGDPTGANYRRNAFDTGEYGVGQFLDSLTLGCDCLGHIHYFDAWSHDWQGKPRHIRNAICMHEEDFGTLWKFTNWLTGQVTVKRSRRLVVSSISTIGNYVYGFFWYFYQDGNIGVEVKATGIPFASALPVGAKSRLWRADGAGHRGACPPACVQLPLRHGGGRRAQLGEGSEFLHAHGAVEPLRQRHPHHRNAACHRASGAQRDIDLHAQRYWKVYNPNVTNALGEHPAYKLVPGVNAFPYQHKDSPVGRRAGFMYHHFWATQFAEGEDYPAGDYPNQHAGRRRPAEMDRGRPLARQRECGRLVHAQLPPPAAAGGLAGAALRLRQFPLDAVGLLRREPGPRRALAQTEGRLLRLMSGYAWKREKPGGAKGDRTPDLGIANAALSQLSYRPF
jgi:primary-amine oxidase